MLRKDRFGIVYPFYAVLAFALVIFNQVLLGGLLLAFAIAVLKDEWTIRQTMQAFFLGLVTQLLSTISAGIAALSAVLYFLSSAVGTVFGAISGVVGLIVFVLSIVGIVRTAKGEDAGIPVARGLTDKAFGLMRVVTYTNMQHPAYPVAAQQPVQRPVQQPTAAQPAAPQRPAAPVQPAQQPATQYPPQQPFQK